MTIKTWVARQKGDPWISTTGAMLEEIDEHRRWHSTNAPRIAALEGLLSHAQSEAAKGVEAIASLESERKANTVLTSEIDELRVALEAMRTDRNEWKESALMSNTRFRLAEDRLDDWEKQEPAAWQHTDGHIQGNSELISKRLADEYRTHRDWTSLYIKPKEQT